MQKTPSYHESPNKGSHNLVKWIEISRSAINHNIKLIRDAIGPKIYLMGMVKANAYGFGLEETSKIFLSNGCDCLGVVSLEEALRLRYSGIHAPIYIMSYVSPDRADDIIRYNFCPMVFSFDFLLALHEASRKAGQITKITIKIETGMNRHGLQGKELEKVMSFIQQSTWLEAEGFCTHFACSDAEDQTPTLNQLQIFNETIDLYRSKGHPLENCHAANTAGTLLYPQAHFKTVRCGLGLYGLSPSPHVAQKILPNQLKCALSFKTIIVQTREIQAGQTVSYGASWTADKETTIAVLPVGYSDGWRRDLSNTGHIMVKGHRANILGRVCMNLFMVDITNIPDVKAGDEVTLISNDINSENFVDRIAEELNTINYEVISRLAYDLDRIIIA